MATLVRSVPEDLYERIQGLAQSRSRSLSAEVCVALARLEPQNYEKDGRASCSARPFATVLGCKA
jgi:hypothetical protein